MPTSRTSPHGDIIASAAKVHLSPIGLVRKGKSRLWLKDHRWWVAVVEFQPSAWSKGTYLNVAASWLWQDKDHFSFDEFKRVGGFAEFTDPESFAGAADTYASRAADEVQSLQLRFPTLQAVANHLRATADGNPWLHYHAMMASLADGQLQAAQTQLQALLRFDHDVPWCHELKAKAAAMAAAATDRPTGRAIVSREVALARAKLRLPMIDESALWQEAQ